MTTKAHPATYCTSDNYFLRWMGFVLFFRDQSQRFELRTKVADAKRVCISFPQKLSTNMHGCETQHKNNFPEL